MPETVETADRDADLDTDASEAVEAVAEAVADNTDVADSAGENDDDADEDDSEGGGGGREGRSGDDLLVREGDVAGDYLERLLDLLDYDGDIDLDVEGSRAVVSIDGGEDLEKLVGPRGSVLEALQELTRLAVQQETGVRSRLMLDIAGWRSDRKDELRDLARATTEKVLASGEQIKMQPMTPFERKVVHDVVASVQGVHSESEGADPRRRVVVFPQS